MAQHGSAQHCMLMHRFEHEMHNPHTPPKGPCTPLGPLGQPCIPMVTNMAIQHSSAQFSMVQLSSALVTPFGHAWVCRGSAQPPCPPKGALHAPWPTTSAWHTPQHPPNCSVWLPMAWRQLSSTQHPLAMHGFGDIWVCARNAQPPCPPEGALCTPRPTRVASRSRIDQYGN